MPSKLDEWFSYSTVKIISIKDKRLGLLHFFFMFLILLYVVGYTLIIEKRYLLTQKPVGTVRLSLQQPLNRTHPSQLPYCTSDGSPVSDRQGVHQCRYWDAPLVVFPSLEPQAMFVSTRVNVDWQELQHETNKSIKCSNEMVDPACRYVTTDVDGHRPSTKAYIAEPERFTMMIDHAIYAPLVGIQRDGQSLRGSLKDIDGNIVPLTNPDIERVGVKDKADVLEISTMLRAAGVTSLDDISDYVSPKPDDPPESFRSAGMVLMVYMVYSNTQTYNLFDVEYYYQITRIKGTEFKTVEPILTKNLDERKVYNRHGIRFVFVQVGNLGRFDFQTLLLSFVSGLGLLAISTLIVDQLAIRVLPQKKIYKAYKINETRDIEELEKKVNKTASQDDLKTLLRDADSRHNSLTNYGALE